MGKLVFRSIAIVSRSPKLVVRKTITALLQVLRLYPDLKIYSLQHQQLADLAEQTISKEQIGKTCDLLIAVGGDGNFLHAAECLHNTNTALLGINCGRLGFLTDFNPEQISSEIPHILHGDFVAETRLLMRSKIAYGDGKKYQCCALNDVVVRSEQAHMVELELKIDGKSVARIRADGLIVATATGSTAYALSAGGPLLQPNVAALTVIPIAAHTLTLRPIVVSANSIIQIKPLSPVSVCCDGGASLPISKSDILQVERNQQDIKIIHPPNYDFFTVCKNKLAWAIK